MLALNHLKAHCEMNASFDINVNNEDCHSKLNITIMIRHSTTEPEYEMKDKQVFTIKTIYPPFIL